MHGHMITLHKADISINLYIASSSKEHFSFYCKWVPGETMRALNESSSTSSYPTDWTIGGFSVPAGNHDDYVPHCAAPVQHVQLWQSRLQHYSADITNTAQEMSVFVNARTALKTNTKQLK